MDRPILRLPDRGLTILSARQIDRRVAVTIGIQQRADTLLDPYDAFELAVESLGEIACARRRGREDVDSLGQWEQLAAVAMVELERLQRELGR